MAIKLPVAKARGRQPVDVSAVLSAAQWDTVEGQPNTQAVRLTSPSVTTTAKAVKSMDGFGIVRDPDSTDGGYFVTRTTPVKGTKATK